MRKPSRKRKQLLLAMTDSILLICTLPLTLLLRNGTIESWSEFKIHFYCFLPVMSVWIITMYTGLFYVLENVFDSIRTSFSLVVVALISLLFGIAFFYLFFSEWITPKRVLLLYIVIAFILIFSWRYLYHCFYLRTAVIPVILCIGSNKTLEALISSMSPFSYLQYKIAAVFDPVGTARSNFFAQKNIQYISDTETLLHFIAAHKIDVVIFTHESAFENSLRNELFSLLEKDVLFYPLTDFYEITTRKIPLGSLTDVWILSKIDMNSKQLFVFIKQILDTLIAVVLTLIFIIPCAVIAFIIKYESSGDVFFKQTREGKNGTCFTILKFRTMYTNNNDFRPTTENDSRITRIGNILRKTRIDELPQLLNVLKGDMALIGPRPERPELAKELEKSIPFYRQRLLVKPGITGWDQVSGEYHSPSVEDTIKKLEYDLYYVKNLSFSLDFSIFFKTIITMLVRSGR